MDTVAAFISVVDGFVDELRACGIKVRVDRDDIMPGQYWKDAIREAIQNGDYFIACYSKELNKRQEAYTHGELRLAIDRLRNMPRNRVWFIPVMINETDIPDHRISDHEILKDIFPPVARMPRGSVSDPAGCMAMGELCRCFDVSGRRLDHMDSAACWKIIEEPGFMSPFTVSRAAVR